MVFYAAFKSISVISRRQSTLLITFLGFTSIRLDSEVSCRRTLPRKNPEDPVRLEPRTPELRVKHFTNEPRRTRILKMTVHYCVIGPINSRRVTYQVHNNAKYIQKIIRTDMFHLVSKLIYLSTTRISVEYHP